LANEEYIGEELPFAEVFSFSSGFFSSLPTLSGTPNGLSKSIADSSVVCCSLFSFFLPSFSDVWVCVSVVSVEPLPSFTNRASNYSVDMMFSSSNCAIIYLLLFILL